MLPSGATRHRQAPLKSTSARPATKASKSARDTLKSNLKQPITGRISKNDHPAKKTVSISEIFKKPITKDIPRHSRRHKRAAPEHELFLDYQDTVTDARDVTVSEGKAKISQAHTYLLTLLTNLESKNATFKASLEEESEEIFSTLDEEKVETSTVMEDGSEIKETVVISKRLAALKATVEEGRKELETCWGEWEGVQTEIMMLGDEVLKNEVSVGAEKIGARSMEARFEELVELLEEDVDGISAEFVERMTSSEKEIALRQNNERRKMLAELLSVD